MLRISFVLPSYKQHPSINIRFWSYLMVTMTFSSGLDRTWGYRTRAMATKTWSRLRRRRRTATTSSRTSISPLTSTTIPPRWAATTSSRQTRPWKSICREDGAGRRASTDRWIHPWQSWCPSFVYRDPFPLPLLSELACCSLGERWHMQCNALLKAYVLVIISSFFLELLWVSL